MQPALLLAPLLQPVGLLRAFYLAASALILLIQAVPALRSRFLAYGSRATAPSDSTKEPSDTPPTRPSPTALDHILDYLASYRVPHSFFTHFYIVSVACSLFWGFQLWRMLGTPSGWPWNTRFAKAEQEGTHTIQLATRQVQLTWLFMIHSIRRLLESYSWTSNSKSQMWIGHYFLGILFYLTVNVAIWIESFPLYQGILPSSWIQQDHHTAGSTSTHSWKTGVLPPAIATAQALQHVYHAYLHDLRTNNSTYQLPSLPYFSSVICPHYTCEVAMYALMALLAAPVRQTVNWTLASATVFVAVNLGVTAHGTKKWYAERFGADKVRGKARMVPFIW